MTFNRRTQEQLTSLNRSAGHVHSTSTMPTMHPFPCAGRYNPCDRDERVWGLERQAWGERVESTCAIVCGSWNKAWIWSSEWRRRRILIAVVTIGEP